MKNVIFFLIVFFLNIVYVQALEPVKRQIGKLNLSIDPRMELLTAVQMISDYHFILRVNDYNRDKINYFKPYQDQKVVTLTHQIENGFSYGILLSLMLHLSQPDGLKQNLDYSDGLKKRVEKIEDLEEYRKAIKEFAVKSNFKDYWNRNLPLYNKILDVSVRQFENFDWIGKLEQYFGETQNGYHLIISPTFMGGYELRMPAKRGKFDLYACVTTDHSLDENNIPFFRKEDQMDYLWQEFGHSFVNMGLGQCRERMDASACLFEPLRLKMSSQTYGDWYACIEEHLIRAVDIRMKCLHIEDSDVDRLIREEMELGFVYIKPLLEKLKEFEVLRNQEQFTFSQFVPQLMNVFDSLAATDCQKFALFQGPVNSAFCKDKVALIYPTFGEDKETLGNLHEYVKMIFEKMTLRYPNSVVIPDTLALKTPLNDCPLMVYGTIESNCFLRNYRSQLPFAIVDGKIVADREYSEPGVKLISCMPNPQNPVLGMIVYTAMSNRDVLNINRVLHGAEDYLIFQSLDQVLCRGFYKKDGTKWSF